MAIKIARGQAAKWRELRAIVSLARLLRDTGRCGEAHAMLAEIYNWFAEGLDTTDLEERQGAARCAGSLSQVSLNRT